MAHNTLCSAMTKAKNFMPKDRSKTQQLKKQQAILKPITRIVCKKCGDGNTTLYKKCVKGKTKYLCSNCK